MAQPMKIKLDTDRYRIPTEEDIAAAKEYILQREEYAGVLGDRIDDVIATAAERVVIICYRYNIDPKLLYISTAFNADMMAEIAVVMDELEATILRLIREYATRVARDSARALRLAEWMDGLGKGDRNLQDTLYGYMYKMMKDWEAAIAAMRYAGLDTAKASTRIRTYLHQIYNMPEVRAAFKRWQEFAATYIRSRGVQYGAVGISNNGSTNVVNMAKNTLQMVWMRNMWLDCMEDDALAGYYVMRGSTYNCDICDDHCGFWPKDKFAGVLPVHPHCQCFAIPIYSKEQQLTEYEPI